MCIGVLLKEHLSEKFVPVEIAILYKLGRNDYHDVMMSHSKVNI